MSDTTFTVSLHATLVDELDECFSPMDGIIAIDQMFQELPRLHPEFGPKRPQKRASRTLKVYRGRYDWYPLGFSYVQIGTTLHVLELWNWDDQADVDVVLGTNQEEWEPTPCTLTEGELAAIHAGMKQYAEKCDANSPADDDDSFFINW